MNRNNTGKLLLALVLLVMAGSAAAPAQAVERVEKRGDFWYDANGKFVSTRHVDPPKNFQRQGTSWREKSEALGIELPPRSAALKARRTLAKPARVDDRPELELNKLIVKFTEDGPVRLRGGALKRSGAAMADIDKILTRYPSVKLRRLHSMDERILDENKDSGERISGLALPDLNNFYLFTFPQKSQANAALANELLALDGVETAYFQAPGEPPACEDIAPATADWVVNQFYRDPAPDGIDIEAAWAYDAGGNGTGTSFWVIDCEWEWCYDHEDIDIQITDVVNTDTPGPYNTDHGTAVTGIIAACDNGFGVSGLTPDINMKMADFDADTTWAQTIQSAVNNLLVGEIALMEIHILGPDPVIVCPCNCSQYTRIPVEWDAAAYAVIATATANGIIIVEAAGNGSMDLDHAIYGGAFDRTIRDSGAIIVGAADPGTHEPSCFTCYGSRVDVHAYGTAIYTTGYGDLFSDTGCFQNYAASFGGTSGASPIIVGACASLQGIANNKWGFDLSPWEMRDLLQVGATPQGASANNIGPMPNLAMAIPALAPDLVASYTPSGWSFPIVPRATADATGSSAIVEAAALPGNATGTYWSWATRNQAAYTATPVSTTTSLTLDDEFLMGCSTAEYAPNQWRWCGNSGGAISIKGGRHTARTEADYLGALDEGSETNNVWSYQFIWSGLPLTNGVPVSRTSDPTAITPDFGPWYNGEGFSGTTGIPYWYAFAVMPTSSDEDYDIRLCTEVPGNAPQQGFGSYASYSSTPAGEMAYVVLDRNDVSSGTYWASVLNLSDATSNKAVEFSGDKGVITTSGTYGPFTMDAGNLIELHEILLPAATPTRIQIEVLSGSTDFGISLHGGGTGYYTKANAVSGGTADIAGAGEDEWIIVESAANDYHGLTIWKKDPSQLNSSMTYNVIVGQNPNLIPTKPVGWYAAVVPRTSTDANNSYAPLPSSLIGNSPVTSFNWAITNDGPSDATTSWSSVYVDDVVRFNSSSGTLAPGTTQYTTNTAQIAPEAEVRGGRHHIRATADRTEMIAEFDEMDNSHVEWFVWTPKYLIDGPSLAWPTPSNKSPQDFGPWFSGDGFRTNRASGTYWTAVGVMPLSPVDDYDLRMHDASTGSKDGFGTYHTSSNDGVVGAIDFTVVNYNAAGPENMDYSIINAAGTVECVIQEADAQYNGLIVPGTNDLGTFTLAVDEFLEIHEFQIDASVVNLDVTISVIPVSGTADLDVRLFGSEQIYANKLTAIASATSAGPMDTEVIGPVFFNTSDYQAVVVHRKDAGDLGTTKEYRLLLEVPETVGVEDPDVAPASFALSVPHPNPTAGQTRIMFEVPVSGTDTRVEVYDVRGRRLTVLTEGPQVAGRHFVVWDGRIDLGPRVGAGIYFVQMTAGNFRETQKVIMLR